MKMTLTSRIEITNFVALIWQGVAAWVQAGEMFVRLLEKNPQLYEQITEEHPNITTSTLARFEQIGRGLVAPGLMLCECPGYDRLEKLPLSQQKHYMEEPVQVYEVNDMGEDDHRSIPVTKLTAAQARQVFDKDRVRPVEEQKRILESAAQKKAISAKVRVPDYNIKGKRVEFTSGVTLTASQLTSILHQMMK